MDFGVSLILQILMGFFINMFFVNLINMTSGSILETSILSHETITDSEVTKAKQSVKEYLEKKEIPSFSNISIIYLILIVVSSIGIMAHLFRPIAEIHGKF